MRTLFLGLVAAGCGTLFVWISGFLLPREKAATKKRVQTLIKEKLEQTARRLAENLTHAVLSVESASQFDRQKRNHPYLLCCFVFSGKRQVFPPPPAAGKPPPPADATETVLAQKAENRGDNTTLAALLQKAEWVETALAGMRRLGEVKKATRWALLPADIAIPLVRLEKSTSWRDKIKASLEVAKGLWRWRPKIWPPLSAQIEQTLQGVLQNAPLLKEARLLEDLLHGLELGKRWSKYSDIARSAPEGFSKEGNLIKFAKFLEGKRHVALFKAEGLLERFMESAETSLGGVIRLSREGVGEFHFRVGAPVFVEVGAEAGALMRMERTRVAMIKLALGGAVFGLVASLLGLWMILQRRAREAHERSRFLSAIGHELKSPLTTIRMYAEMLAGGRYRDGAEMEHLARVVGGQAAALTRQIERLLLFSRMQRGVFQFRFSEAVLDELVKEALAEYAPVAEMEGAKIHFEPRCPLKIKVDKDALKEAVLNLVSNGVKFTPGKPKEVWVRTGRQDGEVFVEVEDRGEGIPEEALDKIFDEYWRLEGEGRPPGAGLGLALVRQIAQAHKGRVEVESVLGKGSLFRIILPQETAEKEDERG